MIARTSKVLLLLGGVLLVFAALSLPMAPMIVSGAVLAVLPNRLISLQPSARQRRLLSGRRFGYPVRGTVERPMRRHQRRCAPECRRRFRLFQLQRQWGEAGTLSMTPTGTTLTFASNCFIACTFWQATSDTPATWTAVTSVPEMTPRTPRMGSKSHEGALAGRREA
jgi:hypothetical protein